MYALKLAADGRVLSIMDERYKKENTPLVSEFPSDDSYDYRYVNGEWVYDPFPKPAPAVDVLNTFLSSDALKNMQAAEQVRKALQKFAATLPEEEALEVPAIYDPWIVGKQYKTGEFLIYGENSVGDPQLYKIVQNHISQADWTPDTASSLYTAIGLDKSGYPVWVQPTGAHDAYNAGDIVNYNGTLYISLINGNVYSPEAYPAGWQVYSGV